LRTMSSAECRFRPAIRFIVPSRPDIGPQDSKTGWTQSAGTRQDLLAALVASKLATRDDVEIVQVIAEHAALGDEPEEVGYGYS
jgi:hypothetical protein